MQSKNDRFRIENDCELDIIILRIHRFQFSLRPFVQTACSNREVTTMKICHISIRALLFEWYSTSTTRAYFDCFILV